MTCGCPIQVIKHLKYSTVSVPSLYEESFKKAILTFQHQRVYDVASQDIVSLSDISDDDGDDLDFLGPYPLYFSSKFIISLLFFLD